MNKKDQEKRDEFLTVYFKVLQEVYARTIGAVMDDSKVSVEIDNLANCIFGAAFLTVSREYARLEQSKIDDELFFKVLKDVIDFNFEGFKTNLPSIKERYQDYLRTKQGSGFDNLK